MLALFGYPIVKNVVMSLQAYDLRTFFTGEAPFVGIANYVEVMSSRLFSRAMVNTALFTIGSIVGQFVIGMALAVFFRKKFPLSGTLRALLLLPWLLPMIASSAAWRAILEQDSGILNKTLRGIGLIDSPIRRLSIPDVALVAVIWSTSGSASRSTWPTALPACIPEELYEAGALDGATGWKAFWHIYFAQPACGGVGRTGARRGLHAEGARHHSRAYPRRAGQRHPDAGDAGPTRRSFVDFEFGQGAALSNVLIVISLVFALVYRRVNRRAIED